MYEDQPYEKDGTSLSEKARILAWSKDVADSTAQEIEKPQAQARHYKPRHADQEPVRAEEQELARVEEQKSARVEEQEPPRVVVNQIVRTPAVVVTRIGPEPTPKEEISTKAVIGTVLGATAGAVVAYAMTRSQTEANHDEQQNRITYRTVDAPVTYESVQLNNANYAQSPGNSKTSHHVIAAPPLTRSYIDDPIPQSDHSHHPSPSLPRSHAQGVTSPATVTKISVTDAGNSRASLGKTTRQSDFMPITEVRSAKDIPLPYSRVTSSIIETREERNPAKASISISPRESVSQVTIRRSGESAISKNYEGHRLGSSKDHEHEGRRPRMSN